MAWVAEVAFRRPLRRHASDGGAGPARRPSCQLGAERLSGASARAIEMLRGK